MAIKTVKATINGQTYDLALNSSTGKWEATITAPGKTSYNQAGGYYNVSVAATNEAGTSGSADATTIDGLKLVVKETVAPVITIVSPTNGAYVTNSKQPVVFTVVDEAGGSGVNISSLVVKLDGKAVDAATLTSTAITNGYSVTYTPAAALADGAHTVTIDCKDNDGNAATQKSTSYTIDTVPPTLNVTSPAEGLVTATSSVTVAGTTNDATSSPVTITISLNGEDQGAVTVGANGSFSKTIALAEGSNTIIVKAKDAAGKESAVTRNVTLDTSVPKIKSANYGSLELITDRTKAGVDAVSAALSRIEGGSGTASDIALLSSNKGSYNYTDLNRVGAAVLQVAAELREYGYSVSVVGKTDWTESDIPTKQGIEQYLADIAAIRAAIPVPGTTPQVPAMPLDYSKANDIEQILLDVYDLVRNIEKSWFFSGELFSGER